MNRAEAKVHVAAQHADLVQLEGEIARLAVQHSGAVLLALVRALVELACSAQGEIFRVPNKIKLYRGVVAMLNQKGIA